MKHHVSFEHSIKIDDNNVISWSDNNKKIDLSIFSFGGQKINTDLRLLAFRGLINQLESSPFITVSSICSIVPLCLHLQRNELLMINPF